VIIQLDNILVVKLVHDLNFELYLLDKVVFNYFRLIDNFDCVDIL